MSWDIVVAGTLRFPKGALEPWTKAAAVLTDEGLPPLIAMAARNDGGTSVAQLLHECRQFSASLPKSAPALLDLAMEGDTVSIRAMLPEDDYREVGGALVALGYAASKGGASGRVLFCNAGTRRGDVVVISDTLSFRPVARRMEAEDARDPKGPGVRGPSPRSGESGSCVKSSGAGRRRKRFSPPGPL
jgi:hypothetical protein